MRAKILIFSILFLLFAIVAVQNTATADINLIFWKIQWPLIVLIMVIFLVGLVMGLIVSSLYERKKKKADSASWCWRCSSGRSRPDSGSSAIHRRRRRRRACSPPIRGCTTAFWPRASLGASSPARSSSRSSSLVAWSWRAPTVPGA